MQLVFWQNILSPHQAPFLRALADLGHDVTVVAKDSMTPDRLALGWKAADMGRAFTVINPDKAELQRMVKTSPPDSVHVMAGARWTRLGRQAFDACAALGRRMGILSEAPDPRGIGGYARRIRYTAERLANGSRYQFVLAMGDMGTQWFRRCGYPRKRVFPFAYVTEPFNGAASNGEVGGVSLLYVGRFIPLKGLDLLLRAFAAVEQRQVRLRLIGAGAEEGVLKELASRLGLQTRLVWLGQKDVAGVNEEMAKADLTVLPSLKDGWGAVVNESLMAGTPVICSSACGAAELVRHPWLGTVFHSGSVPGLTSALRQWIDAGRRSETERARIRDWSRCISGEAVARYFLAILEHVYSGAMRPEPPWRSLCPGSDSRPLSSPSCMSA